MRVLFLHEVNYLEKPIFEMHEFPEHFAALGHEVAFMHFAEGWRRQQASRQGFRSRIKGRVMAGVSLEIFTPQNLPIGIVGRLFMAMRARRVFLDVVHKFKPEVVVCYSVPTSGWQALRVAKKLGIPFIFRALDVSHKIRKSPFSVLVYLAERYIYKNSDAVSANNPAMASYCISMGADPGKTTVDLPPLDLSHFEIKERAAATTKASLGLSPSTKVILYMGSFFYFSGLPEVIRRFAQLNPPDTQLVLVGGGEQEDELRRLVATLGLDDKVTFTGYVSFTQLPSYLALADVAINPMHRSLVANAAFPNKVIQYMAAALAVASTRLEGLEMTFGDSPGLQFTEDSASVLDRAVLLSAQGNLKSIGESNRLAVSRLFSRDSAVQAFESRLEKVMGELG